MLPCRLFLASNLCCRIPYSIDNFDIARAPADIARYGLPDLLSRGCCLCAEQGKSGKEHTRRAVAALRRSGLDEALLQRDKPWVFCEAFHGHDRPPVRLERKGDAGRYRPAIEEHGAGTAVTGLTGFLDTLESKPAQDLEQGLPGRDLERDLFGVDRQFSCQVSNLPA